jgi:predicted nucleotidyltransferase
MKTITIDSVKANGWLIFEAVTGSRAYGLDTAGSDTDIRGVFVMPRDEFYSLDDVAQVSNETNDVVYYELKRFVGLLSKNNPNIMEMLNLPESCVLYRHPVMELVNPSLFLSKLCEQTFANYAYSQIKKAYGLEKKIMQPVSETRKSVSEFCYIHHQKTTLPLGEFLKSRNLQEQYVGLSSVPHLKDCYDMYYAENAGYKGIMKKEESNDVMLSSIPKEASPVALLYFNKEGYSTHCKTYKEYWEWVAKRNEHRYQTTMDHGKKYDAKNMMHVFRLLLMAKEIALEGKINVHRSDRDFLLSIKAGTFAYDDLLMQANQLKEELPELFSKSDLPSAPDLEQVNRVLITMRLAYYTTEKENKAT